MAHFYAQAKGSRGSTHRLGGKSSGADVEVRGWHDGVRVWASFSEAHERNEYTVYFTGGSSPSHSPIKLGTVVEEKGKIIFKPHPRSLNGKDDIVFDL